MDALIELPPESKARIRAKEAKAREVADWARRAVEHDFEQQERTYGGYFDLREQFAAAYAARGSGLEDISSTEAEFVFDAHATEYRREVHAPKELERLLAELREAVVSQYGGHSRLTVQTIEAQAIEKAWNDSGEKECQRSRQARKYVDEEHRRFVVLSDHIIEKQGLKVWLKEHPSISRTQFMDYRAGKITKNISNDKRKEIQTAILESAQGLGLAPRTASD